MVVCARPQRIYGYARAPALSGHSIVPMRIPSLSHRVEATCVTLNHFWFMLSVATGENVALARIWPMRRSLRTMKVPAPWILIIGITLRRRRTVTGDAARAGVCFTMWSLPRIIFHRRFHTRRSKPQHFRRATSRCNGKARTAVLLDVTRGRMDRARQLWIGSAVLPVTTMLAPSQPTRTAISRPSPRVAPVMNMVLFLQIRHSISTITADDP